MALVMNKRAAFDYEVLESFDARVQLHGYEVKSIKQKQGSLQGAYITVDEGLVVLVGAHIPPFQPNNTPATYDPYRRRKLLLTKKEIDRLHEKSKTKGLTIIPISLYNERGVIKAKIAIARGKKKFDKRETIKKRDTERELGRTLKGR